MINAESLWDLASPMLIGESMASLRTTAPPIMLHLAVSALVEMRRPKPATRHRLRLYLGLESSKLVWAHLPVASHFIRPQKSR